jgi:hypothetical protein
VALSRRPAWRDQGDGDHFAFGASPAANGRRHARAVPPGIEKLQSM